MSQDDPTRPVEQFSDSEEIDPRIDFLAGTVAGAAGLVVGQPFDTIKVRFQSPQFRGRYPSTWAAFRDIVRQESVKGLFKGVTSPMASIAFINGVVFTSYGFIMKLPFPGLGPTSMSKTNGTEDEPSLFRIGVAGAGSGFVASFLSAPTELIKIRQQSAPIHSSPTTLSVISSIIRAEGVRGLYRGWTATAGRELGYGPYFITYEGLCRYFRSRNQKREPVQETTTTTTPIPFRDAHAHGGHTHGFTTDVATAHHHRASPPHHHHHHHPELDLIHTAENSLGDLSWTQLMISGGLAGMVSWTATFPLDVVKTRIQSVQPDQTNGIVPPRMTLWQATRLAVRTEGYSVFWRGLAPTLLRAFPANCVVFLTFEAIVAACR